MSGTYTHVYDPSRRALTVADARLTKVLQRDAEAVASLDEYARATGIPPWRLMELLNEALHDDILSIEMYDDTAFVHTAPLGRPGPPGTAEVAPNMWEHLRRHGGPAVAHAFWQLARGLQRAGWVVETNPYVIRFGLSPMRFPTALAVRVQARVAPVVVYPDPEQVASPDGVLSAYASAGASIVALVCESGGLDAMVTAVRRWMLVGLRDNVGVVILEAPGFLPSVITPGDAAVQPRSVSELSPTLASES